MDGFDVQFSLVDTKYVGIDQVPIGKGSELLLVEFESPVDMLEG